MRICGLVKLSLVDFPEKTAATVFTGGCNLRCPFCHNGALVTNAENAHEIPLDEFFSFLEKRRGKLDGVCISGGEPLMQDGLDVFISRVREAGFLVKLDTNGFFPEKLRALIDAGLPDYVAMDVKNVPDKYALTAGVPVLNIKPVLDSIALLKTNRVPYEFRTTLVKGLHTPQDIEELGRLLRGAEKYYLQSFADSGGLIGFRDAETACEMCTFTASELEDFKSALSRYIPHVAVRGV